MTLEHSRDSMPGPDGLPAAAWRAAGPKAVGLLHRCGAWLFSGRRLHRAFNALTQVFAPKGEEDEDTAVGVTRSA
eukprot:2342266-Lingulodinium_polyedra.AAC.1